MIPCFVVSGCTNNSRHFKVFKILFHRFPIYNAVQKQWLQVCKITDNLCIHNARVCSIQFKGAFFESDLKSELFDLKPKRNLKFKSVPHLKIPSFPLINENTGRREQAVKRGIRKEINLLLNEKIG